VAFVICHVPSLHVICRVCLCDSYMQCVSSLSSFIIIISYIYIYSRQLSDGLRSVITGLLLLYVAAASRRPRSLRRSAVLHFLVRSLLYVAAASRCPRSLQHSAVLHSFNLGSAATIVADVPNVPAVALYFVFVTACVSVAVHLRPSFDFGFITAFASSPSERPRSPCPGRLVPQHAGSIA
jgi:hypothetical protein